MGAPAPLPRVQPPAVTLGGPARRRVLSAAPRRERARAGDVSFHAPSALLLFSAVTAQKKRFSSPLSPRAPSEERPPQQGGSGEGSRANRSLPLPRPGRFEAGVPYRITVTAVSPGGLAPAPSVWVFGEELGKRWGWGMEGPGTPADLDPLASSPAPLAGPALWRLQDAPPGTPAVAWGEVPRRQLRGRLSHYTLCAQSGTRPSVCMNGEPSAQRPLQPPRDPPLSLSHPSSPDWPLGSPLRPWERT